MKDGWEPPGLNGVTGAAAGLLNAAIRSLNEDPEGFSATAGGEAFEGALAAGSVAATGGAGAGAFAGCGGEDATSAIGALARRGD